MNNCKLTNPFHFVFQNSKKTEDIDLKYQEDSLFTRNEFKNKSISV